MYGDHGIWTDQTVKFLSRNTHQDILFNKTIKHNQLNKVEVGQQILKGFHHNDIFTGLLHKLHGNN